MPHCRSPLQGDQAIGVTGGWSSTPWSCARRRRRAVGLRRRGPGPGRASARCRRSRPSPGRAARTTRSSDFASSSPGQALHVPFPAVTSPVLLTRDAKERDDGASRERAGRSGRGGASARAEYERRQAKDAARRRAVFGPLAPVVRFIAGPRSSTEAWARGAAGEERVGHWLDEAVCGSGMVLHDRCPTPSRRANIDHLAVVASGIWVIDTKHFRGRLERRDLGGWFVPRPRLFVAGPRPEPAGVLGAPAAGAGRRGPGGRATGGRSTGQGRAVLHRRAGRPLRPALHPGGGARHLAQGIRRHPGGSGAPRARRASRVGRSPRPHLSRPIRRRPPNCWPAGPAWWTQRKTATAPMPPPAPPTGPPVPRPAGSGRAGARPTWRAPCAAACPGRSVPSLDHRHEHGAGVADVEEVALPRPLEVPAVTEPAAAEARDLVVGPVRLLGVGHLLPQAEDLSLLPRRSAPSGTGRSSLPGRPSRDRARSRGSPRGPTAMNSSLGPTFQP